MRKFIVHTRPLPGCCKTSDAPTVVEVEGEVVSAIEDPSVMWLPEGEFRFRILKPESLSEFQEVKQSDGSKKKVMVSPIYHSHAVYPDLSHARFVAESLVVQAFEFNKRKYGTEFTEEEIAQKCSEITEIFL